MIEPTKFAAAEREVQETIGDQNKIVNGEPFIVTMADAFPDGFVVLNEHRQIIFANNVMLEMLGVDTPQDALGKRLGEALNCVNALTEPGGCGTADECRYCGAMQTILAGQAGHAPQPNECRIMREDDSALDLRVMATRTRVQDENLLLFSVQDIEDEKRRRAMERIFFHDVLNTANALLMLSDIVSGGSPEMIQQFSGDLTSITHQLVDEIKAQQMLAAAENNELSVSFQPITVSTALDRIKSQYQHHEISRDKTLVTHMNGLDAKVFVTDLTLVSRVLGNLVKNALEASEAGDTVTISVEETEYDVLFHVHNPAVMPKHVRAQLFQRSFSTKGKDRGLGTYSVKLLMERYLDGCVSFTSEPGAGTCFTVRLPRARVW